MSKKIAIITGASSGLGRMRSGSSRGGKSALKSSRQGSGQILTLLRSILQTKHPLRSCRKSFPQSSRTCAC